MGRALPPTRPEGAALGLAVVVGATLRFANLDQQSFWFDEAYSVEIVRYSLMHVVDTVPETEFTPPLYYLLAWAWAGVAGTDETGVRSLSALFGLATVIVVYLAGRRLVDIRTGIAAAALCAVNPLLIWFSQEARAYSLLALLSALTLLFLALELREPGRRRWPIGWAVAAALMLCTHYFAVFILVPQAIWLLWRRRDAVAAGAVGAVAAVGLALLPLVIEQRETALLGFLEVTPLSDRVWGAVTGIPGGPFADSPPDRTPIELILFGAGLVLFAIGFRRRDSDQRHGAALAMGLAGMAIAVPLAAAPLGFDYVVSRNLIAVLPPLCVALAAGLLVPGMTRIGALVLAAILLVSLLAVDRFLSEGGPHRADWRAVDTALGPQQPTRAIVTHWSGQPTLELYRDATEIDPDSRAELIVEEVVYVVQVEDRVEPPPGAFAALPPETAGDYVITRFHAERPQRLRVEDLQAGGFVGPAVLDRPDNRGRL